MCVLSSKYCLETHSLNDWREGRIEVSRPQETSLAFDLFYVSSLQRFVISHRRSSFECESKWWTFWLCFSFELKASFVKEGISWLWFSDWEWNSIPFQVLFLSHFQCLLLPLLLYYSSEVFLWSPIISSCSQQIWLDLFSSPWRQLSCWRKTSLPIPFLYSCCFIIILVLHSLLSHHNFWPSFAWSGKVSGIIWWDSRGTSWNHGALD